MSATYVRIFCTAKVGDGYPGAMCGCWRNRTTTTKETA